MRIKLARTVQLGIFSRALSISSVYFVMLVRVLILDSEIEWLQLHTNITLRFVGLRVSKKDFKYLGTYTFL